MKKKLLKGEIKDLNSKIADLEKQYYKNCEELGTAKAKLYDKETELNETLKTFDEIRDELTYFKGFHDGVKNGAKVNFSPTINQPQKKEFASGGNMEPRPETVEKVLSFSERMKNFDENVDKLKTENLTPKDGILGKILESFIGSDAKGLVICKGVPNDDILQEIKSVFAEVKKEDDGKPKCNPN